MKATTTADVLHLDFSCREELERWIPDRCDNIGLYLWSQLGDNTAPPPQRIKIKVNGVQAGSELPLGAAMSAAELKNFNQILDEMRTTSAFQMLTDHESHQCVIANDRANADRLIWSSGQFAGTNMLYFWRDSMAQLRELQRELRQVGRVENFTYNLYRVDGSMGEYTKDYGLVDFAGRLCRLSTSLEWRLIAPAPVIIGS